MSYEEQLRGMAAMQNVGMLGQGQMSAKLANANKPLAVIDQQMLLLDERLELAVKMACDLENRLRRVMHTIPESPEVASDRVSSTPCTGVPLGDALAMQGDKLSGIIAILRSINERIEL